MRPLTWAATAFLATFEVGCTSKLESSTVQALWSEKSSDFVIALTGLGADHEAQRATGTLLVPTPYRGPGGVEIRFTCGVTFISPHHAVTAAHCVPDLEHEGQRHRVSRVTVQMYRMPHDLEWKKGLHLTGRYPHMTSTPIPRYEKYVDHFSCQVKVRCSAPSDGPPLSCDEPSHQESDVALLRCDEAVTNRGYRFLALAERDDPCQPPYLRWTHELYQSADDVDAFSRHYQVRLDYASNVHYWGKKRGIEFNQILPLASSHAQGPNPHRKLPLQRGEKTFQNRQRTNIPVCHGASGSGMLQFNPVQDRYELVGVVHGARQVGREIRLCSGPDTVSTYSHLDRLRYLVPLAQD